MATVHFDIGHTVAATLMLASATIARAGGFQIVGQSARATGQGDAYTAQADDASAVYYNPAGLMQLEGTQITAGAYAVYPDFEFQGSADHEEMTQATYLPHGYVASDLGLGDWRFGLGVNDVFGIREDWGDNGELSTIITNGMLTVANIAPTVSYRLADDLYLGASANVYVGEMELESKVRVPSQPAADFKIDGDSTAIGATAGVFWKINSRNALGLTYRSPFQLQFSGSARTQLANGVTIGPSDTQANINFPQIAIAGYAYRPARNLKLEADVQWADWHALKDVQIKSSDPNFGSLPAWRFEYQSTFSYRLGVQYELTPQWTVRAGYIYSPSASPGDTFSPIVVDLDSHTVTAGIGYTQANWEVDLAYRCILGISRTVDSSVNSPPGQYSETTQAVMISLTLKL